MAISAPSYIPHAIVVANGKGGVGKTSLLSNLAGLFARGGLRTLTVDLDPQGNLARDIGYDVDDGRDLFNALITGGPAPVLHNVGGRDGLDCIPGGPTLADVVGVMLTRTRRAGEDDLATMLAAMLAPLADTYDVILIDTPPGDVTINDAALAVCHSVLIPTRADEASLDGLAVVAQRFSHARQVNPALRLLGVALFGIGSRSSRMAAEVREVVEEVLEGAAPMFESRIRYLESAASDQRARGLMIHELDGHVQEAQSHRLRALAARSRGETPADAADQMYTRNASGLARDYEELAREVLIRQREIDEEAR